MGGKEIKRIQQGFTIYGLKPPFFEEFQGGFRVTVYSNSEEMTNSEVGEKLGEKLSKTQQLIIEAMRKNSKISQTGLARMLVVKLVNNVGIKLVFVVVLELVNDVVIKLVFAADVELIFVIE